MSEMEVNPVVAARQNADFILKIIDKIARCQARLPTLNDEVERFRLSHAAMAATLKNLVDTSNLEPEGGTDHVLTGEIASEVLSVEVSKVKLNAEVRRLRADLETIADTVASMRRYMTVGSPAFGGYISEALASKSPPILGPLRRISEQLGDAEGLSHALLKEIEKNITKLDAVSPNADRRLRRAARIARQMASR